MNSTYKSFSVIALLIFSFNYATAQFSDSQSVADNTLEHTVTSENDEIADSAKVNFNAQHLQFVQNQLRHHLSKNMRYPEHLKDYGIEGEIVFEIFIAKNGDILKANIHESLHTEIDRIALAAIDKMKAFELNDAEYEGPQRILFPITISLK